MEYVVTLIPLMLIFIIIESSQSSDDFIGSNLVNLTLETNDGQINQGTSDLWINCPMCGGLNKRNRIVGGRAASIKDFPWTVDIRINGNQHCGGSIIRSKYILTAAHCVAGYDVTKFVVVASVTDIFDTRAFKSKVESGVHHPQFVLSTYDYDVAVLKLARPLPIGKGVRTVCLPTSTELPIGELAIVSGWGAMRENSQVAPNQLQKLGVPIVSTDECQQAKGLHNNVITDRMICAGYLTGEKDACAGDSGGPLVWFHDGVWIQLGIVSWGIGCARAGSIWGAFLDHDVTEQR